MGGKEKGKKKRTFQAKLLIKSHQQLPKPKSVLKASVQRAPDVRQQQRGAGIVPGQ